MSRGTNLCAYFEAICYEKDSSANFLGLWVQLSSLVFFKWDFKEKLSNIGDNLDVYYILIICASYNNAALILCFRLLWLDGQVVYMKESVFLKLEVYSLGHNCTWKWVLAIGVANNKAWHMLLLSWLDIAIGENHLKCYIYIYIYIYFYCQATSFIRMFSMMWQENNKIKQKEVILFNKGS